MKVYRNAKNSSQYNLCAEGIIYKGYSKQLGLGNSLSVEPLVINQNSHQKTKGNATNLFIGECVWGGVYYTDTVTTYLYVKKSLILNAFFSVAETSAQAS